MPDETQAPEEDTEKLEADLSSSDSAKYSFYLKKATHAAFTRRAAELGWSIASLLNILGENIHRLRLVRLDKIPK